MGETSETSSSCVDFSLTWQLHHGPVAEQKAERFNPRPPGVIQPGSASDAVLKFLRAQVGFRSEAQILWVTGRSHSAVSWSLLYLIGQGLVEARSDPLRNARYKKYRAIWPVAKIGDPPKQESRDA